MIKTLRTFCRICVAHCGLLVEVDGDRVLRATGDPDHPVSAGYSCSKGRALPAAHHAEDRLDRPAVGRGPERRTVTWEALTDDLAARLASIRQTHGPDAIAVFTGSGGMDAAGAVMVRRFVRALGTRSVYSAMTIDAPSKPLVGALMAGHPGLFAAGPDRGHTTLTLMVGSNPVVSHGHTYAMPSPRRRLRELMHGGELWVVDPRRTETAALATRHLAPRPGTDHVWLAAVVRETLATADLAALRARASGVDELLAAVEPYTLELAHEVTGVPLQDLRDLCQAIGRHGRLAGLTGTGAAMARTAPLVQWLLTALLVVTDSADAPGGTVFNPGFFRSLDRTPWRPGGHHPEPGPPTSPELPRQFGELPAAALAEEILQGSVRALLVVGGNLAVNFPGADRIGKALAQLEVLATIDVVDTATVAQATHVLACAGQLEREDLNYSTDQYQPEVVGQHTPAVVPPAADRRELWRIVADLAAALGLGGVPADLDELLAAAMRHARADLDTLRERGVVTEGPPPIGWVRDGVASWGGWQLAPPPLVAELERAPLPRGSGLRLVPMREPAHFNTQLTALPDGAGSAGVHLNPQDAAALGLADGQRVIVHSDHGELATVVHLDARCDPGVAGVPHGFEGDNVNRLTSDAELEPLTGMPTFAGLPVQVLDAEVPS